MDSFHALQYPTRFKHVLGPKLMGDEQHTLLNYPRRENCMQEVMDWLRMNMGPMHMASQMEGRKGLYIEGLL